MDSLLKKSASTELEDLIQYINKCQFDDLILYRKISNTFGQLAALFGGFNNNAVSKNDKIKNACVAFNNAFKHHKLGYASANAWVMFIIILLLTAVVFKSSSAWVFYETEAKNSGAKKTKKKKGGRK